MNGPTRDDSGSVPPRPLGFSGQVARRFLTNPISPLLAIAAVLLGLFAVLVTPREEDPRST